MSPRDEDKPNPGQDPETIEFTRSSTGIPERIGRYTIQSVIASGGMGTVYKAVQENPRRAVAVKVMRAGVTSASELRRFEFEAQLLGRLRHPGIAQIYEAGTHDEGGDPVPFFAMEYIPGARTIVEYSKAKKLGVRDRLTLFARVCEVVHYGHQKGIIHRDLKPSNILVGPNGNPHVIDFGVARATDSDMALTQHQTGVGELLGTLQYMSPEQCAADPHDIDTRSDVYALGVVLYELLCDRLPYDVKTVPIYEATRVIRDQDPERPSRVDAQLRGDLETIVLKALEKDRDRRYQSAVELGNDVERYLAREAILARPASSIYHLGMFARRNRGFLISAAVVAVVLLAGAIVSASMYFRSRTYELQAYELEAKATGAQNYLQDIMSVIGTAMGDEVKVARLLETFGDNIDERFAGQPEVEAEVRLDLAQKYNFLTTYQGTVEKKEYAALAEEHLGKALAIRRELYGAEDPRTLATIEEMAGHLGIGFDLARAEELSREALRIRQATGEQDPDGLMEARYRLADVLVDRRKLKEAEEINAQVVSYFLEHHEEEDERTLDALSQHALIQELQGSHEEAVAERARILEVVRRTEEDGSGAEESSLRALAGAHVSRGSVETAGAIYDQTVSITPGGLKVKKWLVEDYRIRADAPTLLVFWESWCPFCQLFVPPIDDLGGPDTKPLQVIGLTTLGGMTEEDGESFVRRNELGFPNAVYDDALRKELGVDGFPMAIAIREGRVVWKGNPSQLSRGFLQGLVRGRVGES